MTFPGPVEFGRSVVVADGDPTPSAWSKADRVRVDRAVLESADRLGSLVGDLHHRWMGRVPTTIELAVADDVLAEPETSTLPPWELGGSFTFLRERLLFLIWNNSYDARQNPPRWWWDLKAKRLGAEPSTLRDIRLQDGTELWVDGGPRGPGLTAEPTISYESVLYPSGQRVVDDGPPPDEDHLAPDQLEAISHGAGPARVIAPAGSGKTRVLAGRVRHLIQTRSIEPELVCAVAYNRRAAQEMYTRLSDVEGVEIRTLHALGWEIVQMARGSLTLLSERDVRRRVDSLVQTVKRPNTDTIGPYLEALSEVRIAFRQPDEVETARDDVPGFTQMLPRYRARLAERNEADHDEQILGAIEALLGDPRLRRHWQQRCRHMLVDEFQDLTPAYLLLLRLLASPALDVFGVGDDDQVIYGYAGADPGYLIEFERLFPGAASHPLETNYRCPVPITRSAATLLGYNRRRVDKRIVPGPDASADPSTLAVVKRHVDQTAETVGSAVRAWIGEGVDPTDIAVLARVNSTLLTAEVIFDVLGIPTVGSVGAGFLDRTLVRATMAWIRVALDPYEIARNDLLETIRRPSRGLNRLAVDLLGTRRSAGLEWLRDQAGALDGRRRTRWLSYCDDIEVAASASATTTDLLEALITRVGLDGAAAALDAGRSRADRSAQSDDLRALRSVSCLQPSPATFESWLGRILATRKTGPGVTLSTIHRVKGLEWDHVVVLGVDRGSMPHALATDIEEERRIFHVGLTRAKRSAVVVADADRPSRFLPELDGTAPVPKAPPVKPDGRPAGAPPDGIRVAVGHQLGIPGGFTGVVDEVLVTGILLRLETGAVIAVPWGERVAAGAASGPLVPGDPRPDPAVANSLRSWRRDTARRLGVPAYVVFNDATLDALASLRPTTEEGLLTVPGIGPTKLENYGDDLLELLAD